MNSFIFEWNKVTGRKLGKILLVANIFLLPILFNIIPLLAYRDGEVFENDYLHQASFLPTTIAISNFGLSIWIIFLIGNEFASGHVNKVIFYKSRKFYFFLKVKFCLMVSVYYSLIGLFSLGLIHILAPFSIPFDELFYVRFLGHSLLVNLTESFVLLALIFIVRHPVIGFVTYLVVPLFELVINGVVKHFYSIDLFLLPFTFPRYLVFRDGGSNIANFYNPLLEVNERLIILPFYLIALLALVYWHFKKRDLKALSD